MAQPNRSRKTWYLVLVGIVALILVSGLISLQPYGSPLNWLIRGMALMGYMAIFLSAVSSAYMRQVYRVFGRPFIKVHHILSVTGLVLVTHGFPSTAWNWQVLSPVIASEAKQSPSARWGLLRRCAPSND